MASSDEKCNFCHRDMSDPMLGWRLKDSTYAKLCVTCASAFWDGTFCYKYHNAEDGWRSCDECQKKIHCGCIMALRKYELNDTCGITCKDCLVKTIPGASNRDPSVSAQLDENCRLLNDVAVNPARSKPLNDGLQDPDKSTLKGDMEQSQLPKSDIIFLFGKKLTPSDCDKRVGRVLLPTQHATKLIPMRSGQRKKPVVINDTSGAIWNLKMRCWPNRGSMKYVLDGARQCCQDMQWNVGDILNFYSQVSDGKLIMELEKYCESGSSAIPLDYATNPPAQPKIIHTYSRKGRKRSTD